mgnify:FL=1
MTKQQEIKQKIDQVYALVRECEQLAKECDGSFHVNLIGTLYGSAKAYAEDYGEEGDNEEDLKDRYEENLEDGWWTPSRNC